MKGQLERGAFDLLFSPAPASPMLGAKHKGRPMIQFAVLVCMTVASAYFAGRIAARKDRSVTAWLWLGAIFGLFALAAVALLPTKRQATVA